MVIQRSTLEFLLVTLILGSIMVATLYLGHGAGVLLFLIWGVSLAIYLKRKSKATEPRQDDNNPS
ncbi:hypothetical protein [Guyparkeria sp.]|uniref:hypothetical protein n=1 Tax=Guyparkeria sp. TaxID=2035736 RepID=UPI003568EB4A